MKQLFAIILCYALLSIFPISTSAHPGRTDSSGGHTNNSTGEYHYHHGYSEHDHYDMDGDGDADCPYDFNNRNSSNIKSTSGSSTTNTVTVYEEVEVIKEVPYTPNWAKWLIGLLSLSTIFLFVDNRSKKTEISDKNYSIDSKDKQLNQLAQSHADELRKKDAELQTTVNNLMKKHKLELQEFSYRYDSTLESLMVENEKLKSDMNSIITNIPVGGTFYPIKGILMHKIELPREVYLSDDHIPIKGSVSDTYPFGDFTRFTSPRSSVYHSNKYCSIASSLSPVHLYDIMCKKRPCSKCRKDFENTPPTWYLDLIKLEKLSK